MSKAKIKDITCETCGEKFTDISEEEADFVWNSCFRQNCGLNIPNESFKSNKDQYIAYYSDKSPAFVYNEKKKTSKFFWEEPVTHSIEGPNIESLQPS